MKKIKINKKSILVLVSVMITGVIVTVYFVNNLQNKENAPLDNPSESQVEKTPSYSEDKTAVEKRQALDESSSKKGSNVNKKDVEPVISSWGQTPQKKDLNISGYVSSVYENGGICTVKISKSGQALQKSQTARKDAQVTTCGKITFDRSDLSKGMWTATLTYESNKAEGSSQSVNIEVE